MSAVNGLRRSLRILLMAVGAAAALGGCGNSEDGPTGGPTSSSASSQHPSTTGNGQTDARTTTSAGSCDGTIGAKAVDEVAVPPGATCKLIETQVDGNVSVGRSGVLVARQIRADGDIEAEGARIVKVLASVIGGNVQLEQGRSATVLGSEIQGDLLFEEQSGTLTASRNLVRGNLQADSNRGALSITGNRIQGDLECEENARVLVSSKNVVSGSREGQCGRG